MSKDMELLHLSWFPLFDAKGNPYLRFCLYDSKSRFVRYCTPEDLEWINDQWKARIAKGLSMTDEELRKEK